MPPLEDDAEVGGIPGEEHLQGGEVRFERLLSCSTRGSNAPTFMLHMGPAPWSMPP